MRGYDPARMRRAMVLACQKIGPRAYRVRGQVEEYYDVFLDANPACYCLDQRHRGEMCKHEIISRLHEGEPTLVQALGDMLLAAEKRLKESTKSSTRRRPRAGAGTPEGA